jgi:hypothetical protein
LNQKLEQEAKEKDQLKKQLDQKSRELQQKNEDYDAVVELATRKEKKFAELDSEKQGAHSLFN